MASPKFQPSLAGIPYELRSKILHQIIRFRQSSPTDLASLPKRSNLQDYNSQSRDPSASVLHLKRINLADAFPTLSVNRKLRAETKQTIEELEEKRRYELDVMVVKRNELEFWPTWIYMPRFGSRVEELSVVFRAMDFLDYDGIDMHWGLFNLLERFLESGPVGKRKGIKGKNRDKRIVIEKLVLNIHSPRVQVGELSDDAVVWNSTGSPECAVAEEIKSLIQSLLRQILYAGSIGRILYERVGEIQVMLDGKLIKEFDLAERLAEIRLREMARKSEGLCNYGVGKNCKD